MKDAKDSAIGGQVNCPLTYRDGYLYTGFWKGAQKDAYFVGIAVADDAKNKNSEGYQRSAWRYMNKGGFYWAGCYATDKYVVVGGDDGVGDDAAFVQRFVSMMVICILPRKGKPFIVSEFPMKVFWINPV